MTRTRLEESLESTDDSARRREVVVVAVDIVVAASVADGYYAIDVGDDSVWEMRNRSWMKTGFRWYYRFRFRFRHRCRVSTTCSYFHQRTRTMRNTSNVWRHSKTSWRRDSLRDSRRNC